MNKRTIFSKIIDDGVIKAELNRFFQNELSECGYAGLELRCAPNRYEILLKVTKTQEALGNKGQRVRELTSVICKRFDWEEKNLNIFIEKVQNRGLSAAATAESIKFKLTAGLAVRQAASGVMRFVMESGAQGVEVIISGKIKGQRAKAMKFTNGLMIHSGQPSKDFVEQAIRSVELRQGVLGIKVKIMKAQDPTGKLGPVAQIPDKVIINAPKEDKVIETPYSENKVVALGVAVEEL